jgi:hypothetical protein
MQFPWYSSLMLAVESNNVVALRMRNFALGMGNPVRESSLMISEKYDAAFEAATSLIAGASINAVVERYRQHVAANASWLTAEDKLVASR